MSSDLGGLIVIDFIDTTPVRHQREVENRLRDAVRQIERGSSLADLRFGLLELSRQRLRPSLNESSTHVWAHVAWGKVPFVITNLWHWPFCALLKKKRSRTIPEQGSRLGAVDVAAFLLNEKRSAILKLEQRHQVRIFIIPNELMQTPHFEVLRVRSGEDADTPSYELKSELVRDTYEPKLAEPRTSAVDNAVQGFNASRYNQRR